MKWEVDERVKVVPNGNIAHCDWITGVITYANDRKVSLRYGPYWSQITGVTYEWIDNKPEKIKKFTQQSTQYSILNRSIDHLLNRSKHAFINPAPIYFESEFNGEHKEYLIITSHRDGVYFYDIKANTCNPFSPYPYKDTPSRNYTYNYTKSNVQNVCLHALDKTNDVLYIMTSAGTLAILNLTDRTWNTISLDRYLHHAEELRFSVYEHHSMTFIHDPVNELHILYRNQHLKYNADDQTLVLCATWINAIDSTLNALLISGVNLFYVHSLKKLILCERQTGIVYSCEVTSNKQPLYKWDTLPLQLPPFKHMVVIQHVMIVFCDWMEFIRCVDKSHKYDIVCLDLLHQKRFVSHQIPPSVYNEEEAIMVQGNDNVMHYLGVSHCTWSLNGVIPIEIENIYRKSHSDPLVFGFIKQEEQRNDMNIPIYLKKIVFAYYPPHFDAYS
eukprot:929104_1